MKGADLAAELDAGFQSAADTLFNELGLNPSPLAVRGLLRACANNAAQALADRTISGETAGRAFAVNSRFDIEQTIKDEIFERSLP